MNKHITINKDNQNSGGNLSLPTFSILEKGRNRSISSNKIIKKLKKQHLRKSTITEFPTTKNQNLTDTSITDTEFDVIKHKVTDSIYHS